VTALTEGRVGAKRIYDPPLQEDGYRVLATRYWPRGVPRTSVDEYVPALAPSRELLRAYRDGEIGWEVFRRQYLNEMSGKEQVSEIRRLAKTARSEQVTLLCVCDEPERCHRWLLLDLVRRFDDGP
jgi:uncharacterized protein YeaO (DUF488 family)